MKADRNPLARDPFVEFITESLDLHAIETLNAGEIAETVRDLFEQWLVEGGELSPADYLDETQDVISRALAGLIAQSPVVDSPALAGADRGALEEMIRLAITLAFAFYTEMSDSVDEGEPRADDDFNDARRLRRMLSIALVYARREAMRDDLIARRIVRDAEQILDTTERLR